MYGKLLPLGSWNDPVKWFFIFDSAKFSQRFHLSGVHFKLISQLGISKSCIHEIRFLKTYSPSSKALVGNEFVCLFSGSGGFPTPISHDAGKLPRASASCSARVQLLPSSVQGLASPLWWHQNPGPAGFLTPVVSILRWLLSWITYWLFCFILL